MNMMNRCFFPLLFLSALATNCVAAQEDEPQVPAESQQELCDRGYTHIAELTFRGIISVQANMDRGNIDDLLAYIEQCAVKSQSFSPAKRQEFALLIQEQIELITAVSFRLARDSLARSASDSPNAQAIAEENKKHIAELDRVMAALEATAFTLKNRLPLDKGWGRDFTANFYLGYEGTSVSGFDNKSSSRAGLMVYNQFTDPLLAGKWGFHTFGNVALTSSAEQTSQDGSTSTSNEIESATEVDLNIYLPYGLKQQSRGVLAIGPLFSAGVRKPDNLDDFTGKYLAGVRVAHSPESFFDIMYGKTEGIPGNRWELRGQLPVAVVLTGNLFVGGALNLSGDSEIQNTDTLRMYVTWQVSFSDIFSVD